MKNVPTDSTEYAWDRLAEHIKRYLKAVDVTVSEIAKAGGVSVATASNWLSGKRTPKLSDVVGIADYVGCSLDTLIERAPFAGELPAVPKRASVRRIEDSHVSQSIDRWISSSDVPTQTILDRCGMSAPMLSNIRHGKNRCSLDKACVLADVLHIPVDALISHRSASTGDVQPPPPSSAYLSRLESYVARMDEPARYALLGYAARLAEERGGGGFEQPLN